MLGLFPVSPGQRRVAWADLCSDDECSDLWSCSESLVSPIATTENRECIEDASIASPIATTENSPTIENSVAIENSTTSGDVSGTNDPASNSSESCTSLQTLGDSRAPDVRALAAQLQTLAEAAKERAAEAEAKASRLAMLSQSSSSELDLVMLERREQAPASLEVLETESQKLQTDFRNVQMNLLKAEASRTSTSNHVESLVADVRSTEAQAEAVKVEIQDLMKKQEDLDQRLTLVKERSTERERRASESLGRNDELLLLRNKLQSIMQGTKDLKAATEEANVAIQSTSLRRVERAAAENEDRPAQSELGDNTLTQLREEALQLHAELDAPTAAGLRAEGLRRRTAELTQKIIVLREAPQETSQENQLTGAPPSMGQLLRHGASLASTFDEAAAQANNQRLLEEVRAARARRDAVQANAIPPLRLEVDTQRARCAHSRKEVASLQRQVKQASEEEADAQREMNVWAKRAQTIEERIRAVERSAQQEIEMHRKTTIALEQSRQARRVAEDQEQLLAWKLKVTVSQLQSLGKSAAARRLGLSLVRPLTAAQRFASKTQRSLNKAALGPLGEDSDANESTTTGGEPVSDADASTATPSPTANSCSDGAALRLWQMSRSELQT